MENSYLPILIGVVGLYLTFKVIVPILLGQLHKLALKTKTTLDEFLVEILQMIRWPVCLMIVLFIGMNSFELPSNVRVGVKYFFVIFVTYWVIKVITKFVTYAVIKIADKKGPGGPSLLPVFAKILNFGVWAIGVIFVISNLGFQVTPLVTGLGVGGIAIALAVQNILTDLFSSVSIYLDKPFKVGDFIVIDGKLKGTVKHVGVKTTRITSLDGEELVVPNRNIVETTIQNFKRMTKRRIVFNVGVTYETKIAKLEKIPEMIRGIIGSVGDTEFGRVHFSNLADSSLDFEVVYFVLSSDYEKYMDIQHTINYELVRAFERAKIDFAYPTQKVFVGK